MREPSLVREVRPGLHLVEARVDDFDVRAAVVQGSDAVLVWDTLAHPSQLEPAASLLARREVVVAYSHADWDHVWGTAAVRRPREIVAQRASVRRFTAEVPAELERRRAAEPGAWDEVRLLPPTHTFGRAYELDLGGVAVRLEHLAGHTADCAVAWIEAWGILLAGDTVETPLPVVNDAAAVPAWIEALRRWEAEPALDLVVPSHGRVAGREVVEATAAYLEGLLRGAPLRVPEDLDAFYHRTHEENVRAMQG